jgi:hypothetical protein
MLNIALSRTVYGLPLCAVLFILGLGVNICNADNNTYIDGPTRFILIKDANKEARAWATCSATYRIMPELFEKETAQSQQLKELGNGAAVSVTMTLVANDLTSNITPDRFKALWSYSILAQQE